MQEDVIVCVVVIEVAEIRCFDNDNASQYVMVMMCIQFVEQMYERCKVVVFIHFVEVVLHDIWQNEHELI